MDVIWKKEVWQKQRDAAGGKGSLVKGVSISGLLDGYHKARKAQVYDAKYWDNVRLAAKKLQDGLQKYATDPQVKENKRLLSTVQELSGLVRNRIGKIERAYGPSGMILKALKDLIVEAQQVQKKPTPDAYTKLYKHASETIGKHIAGLEKELRIGATKGEWLKAIDKTKWTLGAQNLKDYKRIPQQMWSGARHIEVSATKFRDGVGKAIRDEGSL